MKQKASISVPVQGMAKDVNMSQLQNSQYTLAINTNTTNQEEGFIIQNEPSNYLGVVFPENYKVMGFIKNPLKEVTYFFLTSIETDENSPHYKRSSIGYVEDRIIETYNNDQECSDCDNTKNILSAPLETQTQVPSQVYVELENDRCVPLSEIEDKGFNFNINFPIKKIEIKQEKLGTTLYWNDWRNPFRYLQIGRIEEAKENNTFNYLRTQEIPCNDPTEASCLDVSKMLVFPKHKRIVLEADKEQIGGNLKQGTYEFWAAYCDLYGNEITEYSTPTNPISIWDENNYIQSQVDTDDFTNYAIKIKVSNLDIERFKYYKVAVVERNNVNNTQSVFVAGIYPTTDNIVVYTHSASNNDDIYITRGNISIKKRMDFETLTAIKPQFKRMKGTMVSDDRLFGFGLEVEEEINLQPVVNLFSSLVKAQTSVANENLYKSAIATSKYKQFPRDEVQPLAIRFLYDDGGYSANFPFVGRPKTEDDAIIIEDTNKSKASLIDGQSSCSENIRVEKWQIFNTAKQLDTELCFDIDAESIELPVEEVEKTCYADVNTVIPANIITITDFEEFDGLENYVNNNPSIVIDEITPYLLATYPETCDIRYIGNCDTPVLKPSTPQYSNPVNQIDEVLGEKVQIIYKEDASEYLKTVAAEYCYMYKRNEDENATFKEDLNIDPTLIPCQGNIREKVYLREGSFQNEVCAYATPLPFQSDPSTNEFSIYLNYEASKVLNNLLTNNTNFSTTFTGDGFYNKIHNKAQFFSVEKGGREKIVFEISKKSSCDSQGDAFASLDNLEVRYVIYDNCTSRNQIGGGIVTNLNEGFLTVLDVTTFPENFIIAIDTKIVQRFIKIDCSSLSTPNITSVDYILPNSLIPSEYESPGTTVLDDSTGIVYTYKSNGLDFIFSWQVTHRRVYYVAPPCGCFGVSQRDVEPKEIIVEWDSIKIRKKSDYIANCKSSIPKFNSCDPIPFKKYGMAYWESVIDYPDNKQLYDSSFLKIRPSDLSKLTDADKADFANYFTNGLSSSGNYIWKEEIKPSTGIVAPVTDLTCRPLRHPKFPDNTIAPFLLDNLSHEEGADAIIFPMGINLDSNIVKTMLDVAYINNLITKVQKEKIVGWEILKGDNSVHKSKTASGILYDVYNYKKKGDEIHFSNFPFNDLGNNKFVNDPSTKKLIKHPYNGSSNNKFTFISPDMLLTKPQIPAEMSLQGYMLGSAQIDFANVDKHPKWTVLGKRVYKTANTLALAEVILEAGAAVAGTDPGGGFAGVAKGIVQKIAMLLIYAAQGYVKYGSYRYEWLQIFRNLGRMDNFASFQFGEGKHNKFLKLDIGDENQVRKLSIRKHLRDGNFDLTDENDGKITRLNNNLREHSVFLSTGNHHITYPEEYKNFDNNVLNNRKSSNVLSSEVEGGNPRRNIANPYIYLKNYIPDQWDTIDSIKWLTTNYIFDLQEDTTCKVIYGGSEVISRFSWRVKVPFFDDNAIGIPDKLPYLYSKSSNIGNAVYYCDYETADNSLFEGGFKKLKAIYPDINSNYNFDQVTGRDDFYLRPPSKFYLFTHGVIDFLVESEINCNFRYGRKEPKDQFYKNQNLSKWLQEVNLPIIEPNTFFYNNSYTFPVSNTPSKKLSRDYNKDVWKKRNLQLNAWVCSEKDVNENALIDPWLTYKPLNFWEEKTNRGELIDLRSIESGQFLGRYENELQLYNPANPIADAINVQNRELGIGFMGARPISFKKTDLGFAGTQNTDFVSTPYGHFWVDAKRGRVFQIDQNGGNMEIISEVIQGKPSNMKQWFREQLPFKILKQYPQVDVDNKFKGLGLNMWYDDRQSRVFITKRDYIAKNTNCLGYNDEIGFYNTCDENKPIYFDNTDYFDDVSWTISYKPTDGMWNSFFTFYPDFSPYHQEYFQVGYNWGKHKGTLWNHLMNNNSFCVFQGEYNPFVIEFPISNENATKILNSVSFNIEARRYNNYGDFSIHKDIGITDMFIYNQTKNSGYLVLHPQKTLAENKKYPYTENNKQHIITSFTEGKQLTNYFFNRVVNQDSNVPMFKKDINNIFKVIDPRAVKFGTKKILERMAGEVFLVNISNVKDSSFNILIKNSINNETVIG